MWTICDRPVSLSTEKCMLSLNPEILGDRGQRGHSSEVLVQDPWQPVTSTVSYPYPSLFQSGGCGNTELIMVSLGVRWDRMFTHKANICLTTEEAVLTCKSK